MIFMGKVARFFKCKLPKFNDSKLKSLKNLISDRRKIHNLN